MPLPGPDKIEVFDVVNRHLVLPVGTSVSVPARHEWVVLSMTVLPHPSYSPPGTPRDVYAYGDIQLCIDDQDVLRANALTLMDRYWGRYNLHPELTDALAKLEQAQHAIQTAPTLPDLAITIEKASDAAKHYQDAVAPRFDKPGIVKEGCTLTVSQERCEFEAEPRYASLDIELLLVIKRPCRGRRPEDAR
jgi:hypothetical protein